MTRLMKTNWADRSMLRFQVLRPFCKYRIPTVAFGATKYGGIALSGLHLEMDHYNIGTIELDRQNELCRATGWHLWQSRSNIMPISGYELHALCSNKTIEEIDP